MKFHLHRVWKPAATAMLALVAGSAEAAFRDPLWSARAAALGGAFTALGDDPTAAFYNPAATTELKSPAANFTYAKLFAGLDEVNVSLSEFAYVRPLKSFNVLSPNSFTRVLLAFIHIGCNAQGVWSRHTLKPKTQSLNASSPSMI
jgi:hypothetical protein